VVRALAVYAVLLLATLASPLLMGPLGRLAGAPFARISRLEERLARASLVRDRSRTALTVGALTIGLAMIVAIGGVAQNARRSAGAWLASVVPGDFILTSIRPIGFDETVLGDISGAPGVARVTPVARFDLAHEGVRLDAAAVRGADLLAEGRPAFTAGDPAAAMTALDAGGAVVLPESQAERLALGVGDRMTVTGADGAPVDLAVAGIVEHAFPGSAGETVLVGWDEAMGRLGVAGADFFVVRLEPDASTPVRLALQSIARQMALEPATIDRIQGAIADALGRVFGLFDALALVAVLVAALGIVNTLTMNVVERVREIGMLRATGMTRRQVGRMVVVEAGILGLVGAILGALTGLAAGTVMVVLAGGRLPASFELPWPALAVCLVLGVGVSMAAAWYPARLAGRLSIVRAVQFE
jgi:putative ABC transport system permease protein